MTVTQIFIYTWPEGTTPIAFQDWIKTLTQAEQDEFAQSLARQLEFRQKCIDDGLLELANDADRYVWKDEDAFKTNKPTDHIWSVYWEKWIKETGVQFSYDVL
jgi:hypothetical protein